MIVEGVTPQVDAGRFPVKRTIGERVVVEADVFTDGHDSLRAVLHYRFAGPEAGNAPWIEVEMTPLGNDRWRAPFRVTALGRYEYTVQGWIDRYDTWRKELAKKAEAGADVSSELLEGANLLIDAARSIEQDKRTSGRADRTAQATAIDPDRDPRGWLLRQSQMIAEGADQATRIGTALSADVVAVMAVHAARHCAATSAPLLAVTVEREIARFGAWYEMFPRSAGPDPTRSATFDEAAGRLPDIASLGFDVVYLPPIHPIGRSFRKGRNNALQAEPADPGSPWAIGADEGGHKAVEPGLGTLDDFDRFLGTAKRLNLEVALDLAYQASPDHPYVTEHPEWFRHRPDGTIKYAENPPKKYQDIYPFDFESKAWRDLWNELKSIVVFWAERGVRIFRVDNPHTKALTFWEWMIADLKRGYPDLVLLSEAFTRPKVMRYLAKAGFSQSYTYFTWRNTKAELVEYFSELAQTDVREYFRSNLFANTPDILHEYLQTGGRPAFQIRLVLAATLGANYGIYSGYELAEHRTRPGTEEYLDSEKYQFRQWDWGRPGNIVELVCRVNQIRRDNPALHSDWSLEFHDTDNDEIIFYSKATDDLSNVILVVVNLDYSRMQHGWIKVPIHQYGFLPDAAYEVHDLLADERYHWRGEWNYVRLDPESRPAHVLRLVTPAVPPAS